MLDNNNTNFAADTNRAYPNVMIGDKRVLSFSNIPTLDDVSDMRYFSNYIKGVSIPSYSVEYFETPLPFGAVLKNPIGRSPNRNLQELPITFKVSEDMKNYLLMFKWMYNLRYRESGEIQRQGMVRYYGVDVITLTMLDTLKRPIADIQFTHAMPTTLSSLDLAMGIAEEKEFTVNFLYQELNFNLHDPMVGGIGNPTSPTLATPVCGTSGIAVPPTLSWTQT